MSQEEFRADKIFRADPLILREESQKEYGEVLLENVLLSRTSKYGVPDLIDLYDSKHRAKPPASTDPPPPAAVVAEKYLESRINRHKLDLTASEEAVLRRVTMVSRGELTAVRLRTVKNPATRQEEEKLPIHDEARDRLADADVDINRRLRIAAIGTRVKVSLLRNDSYLGEDLCVASFMKSPHTIKGMPDKAGISEMGRTARPKKNDPRKRRWARWIDSVFDNIKAAVDSGSQVIVLPEFALPPEVDAKEIERRVRENCHPKEGPEPPSHFIFAGSRHEGAVNRGLVLYSKKGHAFHPPEWHYKFASARALGENVLGPRTDTYKTYKVDAEAKGKSFPIHVTVAICYDTFDPSTFLSLVRQSPTIDNTKTPQIILVPSFNPSEEFVQLLRDLSFLTGAIVIYVNSLHGDARAFIAGCSISALLDGAGSGLLSQFDTHIKHLTDLKESAHERINAAQKRGETTKAKEIHDKANFHEGLLPILRDLRHRTNDLILRRGMADLITVERCRSCTDGAHEDDYLCRTDVLYYNIDVDLIDILYDWRRLYIQKDESFIPAPFHYDRLRDAMQEDEERRKERERERVGI